MQPTKVAMTGCFRSGTNFAKTLLEQNFHCEIKNNVFGWKHGFLPIISSDSNVQYTFDYEKAFFITKNPFSFLVSLFKYHLEVQRNLLAPTSFKAFIREKLIVHDQANPRSAQLRFSNPIDYWNAINWNFKSHPDFEHVRYEMMVKDPQPITNKLAAKLGLQPKEGDFFVPDKKVKRINDAESLHSEQDYMTTQRFDKNSYLSDEYMSQYDAADIEWVSSQIDMALADKLGYTEILNTLTQK